MGLTNALVEAFVGFFSWGWVRGVECSNNRAGSSNKIEEVLIYHWFSNIYCGSSN